ncbi:hypothetical protein [Roseobacter sp. HKCCA0434]|uniref:hypothetical protein n=1 Tax=Roseobacter sp. HKCCA0434 TaxID=3079297 RepID=UPI002905A6C7|nr:hypothetical protein [Roseobacter sp. HKCCA0434]
MLDRRFVLLTLAALPLAACAPEPEPVFVREDSRVAAVSDVSLGRSPGGYILTARATDMRGVAQRTRLKPAGRRGDVLIFDVISNLAPREDVPGAVPQQGMTAGFIPDADLAGINTIELRTTGNSVLVPVPRGVAG